MDDDAQLAAQQEAAAAARTAELHDLATLLRSEQSRRVLRRILTRAGIFRLSFDAASDRLTALREGERNVGLWLFAEMTEAWPETVGDLIVELQKPNRLDPAKS
jgi:hypothetical protein